MSSDQNNPDVFIYPETYPRNFSGDKKVYGVVSAACLILMTIASVSLYSIQVDYVVPVLTLTVLTAFTLIIISLRGDAS